MNLIKGLEDDIRLERKEKTESHKKAPPVEVTAPQPTRAAPSSPAPKPSNPAPQHTVHSRTNGIPFLFKTTEKTQKTARGARISPNFVQKRLVEQEIPICSNSHLFENRL